LAVCLTSVIGTYCAAEAAEQQLRLANIFTDNMVLQRDQPATIWGWAKPGADVRVTVTEKNESVAALAARAPADPPYEFQSSDVPPSPAAGEYHATIAYVEHNAKPFATVTRTATADGSGAWEVEFPPMAASFRPKTILAQSDGEVDAAENVLIGIVWLNTGQSNIQIRRFDGGDLELPGARYPGVRFCKLDGSWYKPKEDLSAPAHWLVCSPRTAVEVNGVTYFFATTLHRYLNVPVGIINNARGGTTGQAWCSRESLDTIDHPAFQRQLAEYDALCKQWESPAYRQQAYETAVAEAQAKVDAYQQALAAYNALPDEAKQTARPPKPPKLSATKILRERRILNDAREAWSPPAGLFNAVVYPLRKLKVDGMLFYQGENNNFGLWSRYEHSFPRVITSHCELFGDPLLPIGVIELPGWKEPSPPETSYADGYAMIRDVHNRTVRRFDACEMIICNDLGGQSIHPGDKRPVAERAARWALASVYGAELPYQGPIYREMEVVTDEKTGQRVARVYFDLDPLFEKNTAAWQAENPGKESPEWVILPCPLKGAPYSGFAIAGEDRLWHPANVVRNARAGALEISSPLVAEPVAVRYGWANTPAGNALNRGFPMLTFRTDDWPLPSSWPAETPQQQEANDAARKARRELAERSLLERQMAELLAELPELEVQRHGSKFGGSRQTLMVSKARRIAQVIAEMKTVERKPTRELQAKLEALSEALDAVVAEIDDSP